MLHRASRLVREQLIRAAGNESLFLCVVFLMNGFSRMSTLTWYVEQLDAINRFLVIPWGSALAVLRLVRAQGQARPARRDLGVLLLLLCWIVVPFGIRFGLTQTNVNSWYQYMVAFFGLYALVSEEPAARLERLLDAAGALFALVSFALGGALLYCALTVQGWAPEQGQYLFGVDEANFLSAGLYYNATGMLALCCALMSLLGVARRRSKPGKLAHLIPALMMMLVVVLTQSRTARYSLLAALAAGLCAAVAHGRWSPSAAKRWAAGIAAGALMLAGGYLCTDGITRAAIAHYTAHRQAAPAQGAHTVLAAQALAQEEAAHSAPEQEDAAQGEQQAAPAQESADTGRGIGDWSFSERTVIWKRVLELWAESPWYLLIGRGVGNVGSLIAQNTHMEALGATTAHNTYLQFISEFGLIGALLLLAFFASILRHVLRVLLASAEKARPGDRVLGMVVLAALLTGMMESEPLGAMTPINAVMLFSLGALVNRGLTQSGASRVVTGENPVV